MVLKILHSVSFLRRRYFSDWGPRWVSRKVSPFLPYLEPGTRIVDIGSGGGLVIHHLRKLGFKVDGLDIADQSYDPSVKPIVYDGQKMPFAAGEYDTALLLTVLHHTENPCEILAETARVAQNIIIIEDIYSNKIQQYLTYWMDAFINWGYSPCPRTNKNDAAWREAFKSLGLEVKAVAYRRVLVIFRQAIYVLASDVDFSR